MKIASFTGDEGTVTLVAVVEISLSYPLDITVDAEDVAMTQAGKPGPFIYDA